MEKNENLIAAELQIDSVAYSYLSEASKWGKFLAILGFIFTGIFVIVALFAGTLISRATAYGGSSAVLGGSVLTIIYLIVATINLFISLFLYRFSIKMKAALYSNDQGLLNNSFLNLKNLYKMMGIIAIIYLSLMAILFLFALFVGMR